MEAAGIFFFCNKTRRYLYLLRADNKQTWSLPGGKIENNETLLDGLIRECTEEMGIFDPAFKLIPIQKFTNHNFCYHTFFCETDEEFVPELNDEHLGYAWVNEGKFPKPLHPGLFSTINFDVVCDKLEALTSNLSYS